MPRILPVTPQWLRTGVVGRPTAVDREARILRGYVLAQEGPFRTAGRGEFDRDALKEIVRLGNARLKGLKSRFAHPTLSGDGLGKFLGRVRDLRLETARDERTGKTVSAVRGDLHFDTTASRTPDGDLAGYVLDLAESDPDALSSSLVLEVDEERQLDEKKRPREDEDGNELPPFWRPKRLHASDIVDTGDAVDGLLSALATDALPDAAVRQGAALLDQAFAGQPWEVVEARCLAWLQRYKELRFGEQQPPVTPIVTPQLDACRLRLEQMALTVRKFGANGKISS